MLKKKYKIYKLLNLHAQTLIYCNMLYLIFSFHKNMINSNNDIIFHTRPALENYVLYLIELLWKNSFQKQ